MISYIVNLFRINCRVRCRQSLKFACDYLTKNVKKFYTYNFYSFENKLYGFIILTLYFSHLLFNIFFAINVKNLVKDEYTFNILRIVSFELHMFFKLVCITFYLTRNLKKQFLIVGIILLTINMALAILCILQSKFDVLHNNPKSIALFKYFFIIIFVYLYSMCFKTIFLYNKNCNLFY